MTLRTSCVSQHNLLNAIKNSTPNPQPFKHWNLREVFSEEMLTALINLPSKVDQENKPHPSCSCRRPSSMPKKITGDKVFFTELVCQNYPVCQKVVDLFQNPNVISALEEMCDTDFTGGHLRIGYYSDRDGFFIAPHTDEYQVKMISIVIYLDASAEDLGIEMLDEDHNIIKTMPSTGNTAVIFLPAPNTWHQASEKPLSSPRKTLVINYVNDSWCNKQQLCKRPNE